MKKKMALALSLAMAATTLAPAAVSAADEQVTLTIMSSIQTEDEGKLESAIADAYMEQNPNVKIEFISVANNDLDAQITTMAASDDLPDAFYMNCAFMSTALDMGIVADSSKYISDEYKADVLPEVLDYATVDGNLMFIPWFQIPVALIYRTDWLEQAGIDKIETMDDFREAAKAFTDISGNYGFSMVGTRNGSGEARFSVYDKAYGGLIISGSNAVGAILNRNPELAGKLGSIAIPAGTTEDGRHVTNLQVSGYAITSTCEHPEEMAAYLEFAASYDNAVSFGSQTGRIPVTESALADEAFSGDEYTGFKDCMQYSIPYSTFPGYAEVQDIMGEAYNSMLTGTSLEDAMATVDSRITDLLAEYNK